MSHTHRRYSYNNTFDFSEGMLVCFPNNIIFIVTIYVVVNFLSQVIFCFSFVVGYGNVANEVETMEK